MAGLTEELVDLALNGYPALDLSTVTADEEFVCTPAQTGKTLSEYFRGGAKGPPPQGNYRIQLNKIGVDGDPNGITVRVAPKGQVRSVAYYNAQGQVVRRVDVQPHAIPHTYAPHVHYYRWGQTPQGEWRYTESHGRPLGHFDKPLWEGLWRTT